MHKNWKCSGLLDRAFHESTESEGSSEALSSKQLQSVEPMSSSISSLVTTSSVHSTLNHSEFLSISQPYPHSTQHIKIGTVNIYQGQGTEQTAQKKRRRIILDSDSDSE